MGLADSVTDDTRIGTVQRYLKQLDLTSISQFSLRMIRQLRAGRIGKASAYRADKELRLEALGQKADLTGQRKGCRLYPDNGQARWRQL